MSENIQTSLCLAPGPYLLIFSRSFRSRCWNFGIEVYPSFRPSLCGVSELVSSLSTTLSSRCGRLVGLSYTCRYHRWEIGEVVAGLVAVVLYLIYNVRRRTSAVYLSTLLLSANIVISGTNFPPRPPLLSAARQWPYRFPSHQAQQTLLLTQMQRQKQQSLQYRYSRSSASCGV